MQSWLAARWQAFLGSYDPDEAAAKSSPISSVGAAALLIVVYLVVGELPVLRQLSRASATVPSVLLALAGGVLTHIGYRERCRGTWGALATLLDNGFYAELADPSGTLATEVLIDPDTGDVQIEYGPAMMWNAAYGMHPRPGVETVSAEQAAAIADEWLETHRPGEHADDVDAFPGYYTLHTLRGDQVAGMLSVNAVTGAVWPHTWHGRFIAMTD